MARGTYYYRYLEREEEEEAVTELVEIGSENEKNSNNKRKCLRSIAIASVIWNRSIRLQSN